MFGGSPHRPLRVAVDDQFVASWKGHLSRVTELVRVSNVNDKDFEGASALHRACEGGHEHVVKMLLAFRADTEVKNDCGWTPLWSAAANGHAGCLRLLLAAGASVTSLCDGLLPLQQALRGCQAECVVLLLAAHLRGVDSREEMEACRRILFDSGPLIGAMDQYGCTPLYWAFANNDRHVATLLLFCGASLEGVRLDEDRLTAVPRWALEFGARRNGCRLACFAVLCLQKMRSTIIGSNGRDALRLVAQTVWNDSFHPAWEPALRRVAGSESCFVC